MLSLSMSCDQDLTQRQCHLLECSCCGKDIGKDAMHEGPLMVLLDIQQGKDPQYRLCPTCFQYVGDGPWDASYKRKWTIRAKKLIAKGARISFGSNVHIFTADKLEEAICKTLGIPVPPRPVTKKESECAQVCADLMDKLKGTNWQI